MTSSTRPGSMPASSTSALSTWADRSTGWMSRSAPLRLPTGVRTAPTITASRVTTLVYHNPYKRYTMLDDELKARRRKAAERTRRHTERRGTHVEKHQDRRHRDHRPERR